MKTKTCKCGKKFQLGVNGVYDDATDEPVCDQCAGVMRDQNGTVWTPEEQQNGMTLRDIATGEDRYYQLIDGQAILCKRLENCTDDEGIPEDIQTILDALDEMKRLLYRSVKNSKIEQIDIDNWRKYIMAKGENVVGDELFLLLCLGEIERLRPLVEQQSLALMRCGEKIEKLEAAKFIACAEQQPDECVDVEFATIHRGYRVGRQFTDNEEECVFRGITHWRPLPTPPDEVQE